TGQVAGGGHGRRGQGAGDLAGNGADVGGARGGHVDGVHRAGQAGQGLRAGQRDVEVGGALALRGRDDADDAECLPGDRNVRPDLEVLRLGVVGVHDGDVRVRFGRGEAVPGGDRAGAERPQRVGGRINPGDGERAAVERPGAPAGR